MRATAHVYEPGVAGWCVICGRGERSRFHGQNLSASDRAQQAEVMREAGQTLQAIGDALGVSRETIRLDLLGYETPRSDAETRARAAIRQALGPLEPAARGRVARWACAWFGYAPGSDTAGGDQ